MSPTLQGKDYRAIRRVSDADNATLAAVGATCEDVPAASLPALLASGKIEWAVERRAPVETPETPAAPPKKPRKGRR